MEKSETKPLVSMVIPIFNEEESINETMGRLLAIR
jgi:glycosyltransferase involved in cell wall biosynthesis